MAIVVSFILKSDPEISEYEKAFGEMTPVDMSQLDKDNVFLVAGKQHNNNY